MRKDDMESFVKRSITINAEPSKVWNALTNPEITKKYMYDCAVVSDWKIGGEVLWNAVADGKEITYVKGTLLKYEKDKVLQYTVFDPNMGLEDIPSNYLTTTYILEKENGKTILNISQGDYSKVDNSEKRYNDTVQAWDFVLKKMKEIIEGNR